ncbi:hypothetical protein J2S01_001557, partial [Pectinatus haikarae]|nr:hypothetical protein [Pectinatus haikarae]
MNSIAVGMALDFMMGGTALIACSSVGKGTSRLTFFLGRGKSRRIALVMIASVPSEPT